MTRTMTTPAPAPAMIVVTVRERSLRSFLFSVVAPENAVAAYCWVAGPEPSGSPAGTMGSERSWDGPNTGATAGIASENARGGGGATTGIASVSSESVPSLRVTTGAAPVTNELPSTSSISAMFSAPRAAASGSTSSAPAVRSPMSATTEGRAALPPVSTTVPVDGTSSKPNVGAIRSANSARVTVVVSETPGSSTAIVATSAVLNVCFACSQDATTPVREARTAASDRSRCSRSVTT